MSEDKAARLARIKALVEEATPGPLVPRGTWDPIRLAECIKAAREHMPWLVAELEEARALLRSLEWNEYRQSTGPDTFLCHVCRNERHEGHTPDCRLARMLSAEEPKS